MPKEKVLICGAGVAGSVLAYWLARSGFDITVIERSRSEQKQGQGIEIETIAVDVVKAMSIFPELNSRKTGELGFKLVNDKSQPWAVFDVSAGASPTGELEMMRGELTDILYKAADAFPNVTYHFETTIESLTQTADKVVVETRRRSDKQLQTAEYDLVIGADGFKSRTRTLAMGSPEQLQCYKPVGSMVAYFSIPKEDRDWPYSTLCHFPGRRIAWLRPTAKDAKDTSVYLIHCKTDSDWQRANASGDRQKQKLAIKEVYKGLGWECPRFIEYMMTAENFYSEELTQVKLKSWSKGRVALVGDSAWAPTPFTGQGNQLAIIGAFVLAQEMTRNGGLAGFQSFEKRFRKYVEDCQSIPLNGYAPYLLNPETTAGIAVVRTFLWGVSLVARLVAWSNVGKFFPEGKPRDYFDLDMENGKDGKKDL
ncbi:hypothetical protein ANO11243_035040 [Dothideomycetidae sp. 11243]|nr:hypothetical protein ANO11243_035040 [fungal sp. No.11243]